MPEVYTTAGKIKKGDIMAFGMIDCLVVDVWAVSDTHTCIELADGDRKTMPKEDEVCVVNYLAQELVRLEALKPYNGTPQGARAVAACRARIEELS